MFCIAFPVHVRCIVYGEMQGAAEKGVSCIPASSSLEPVAWRALLESSSKPLVVKGQLGAWLDARSWKAADVCADLSSATSKTTSFKLCPRRNTPLYQYLTGGEKRALLETDCTYVEATFANFKEWLEKTEDSENQELQEKASDGAECSSEKEILHQHEDYEVPVMKKAKLDYDQPSPPSNPLLTYPSSQYWVYADYKHMCNVCPDIPQLQDPVDWSSFGLEGRGWRDSTLWVGSVGACTPCHYDAYGYNLVAQLSGRKSWTLFSPGDSPCLYPTRVPYEDTSVFSEVDVLEPDYSRYPKFREATPYQIVLEEGDVLMVPKHWWHYVECVGVGPAVSVNTWIPVESDSYDKIKEALVRTLVSAFAFEDSDSESIPDGLLNPNEEVSTSNAFNISTVLRAIEEHKNLTKSHDQQQSPGPPSDDTGTESTAHTLAYRDFVRALTSETVLTAITKLLLK